MAELVLYSLIYFLLALCVVYPPTEFISAGLTIPNLFSSFLGDEGFDFVEFHLRRTTLTAVVHSALPFFYFLFLEMTDETAAVFVATPSTTLQRMAQLSVVVVLAACAVAFLVWRMAWCWHPLVRVLKLYNAENWTAVATTINDEYRRIDTFTVSLSGISRVIVTDSWILYVSTYGVACVQQSDARLEAVRADEHMISHHSGDSTGVQFVDIEVRCIEKPIRPFLIRLRAESLRDIRDKLARPIDMARSVILRQSLSERFVHVFLAQVTENARVVYDRMDAENLELCLGCSTEQSNVKLQRRCGPTMGEMDDEGNAIPSCTLCFCRPMWCVACMARIFASKQDQRKPELWMAGKTTCPTCRATFCVLDVCLLQIQ